MNYFPAMYIHESDMDPIEDLSFEYFSYMRYRAMKENKTHIITLEFYYKMLKSGVKKIFGIYHDGEQLINDEQNQNIFQEWNNMTNINKYNTYVDNI